MLCAFPTVEGIQLCRYLNQERKLTLSSFLGIAVFAALDPPGRELVAFFSGLKPR